MRNPGQVLPDHAAILATLSRSTPTGAGHAAPGTVARVTGQARPGPGGLLTAPVSGRPCVWYRVLEVNWPGSVLLAQGHSVLPPPAAFRSDMYYEASMGTQTGGESVAWFAVGDGSGEVLVDPVRGDVDAAEISVDTVNAYSTFGEGRAVREWIVAEGSPVFVCGPVRSEGDRAVVGATPEECLVVSTLGEQAAVQRSRTVSAAVPSVANSGRSLVIGLAVAGAVLFVVLIVLVVVLLG